MQKFFWLYKYLYLQDLLILFSINWISSENFNKQAQNNKKSWILFSLILLWTAHHTLLFRCIEIRHCDQTFLLYVQILLYMSSFIMYTGYETHIYAENFFKRDSLSDKLLTRYRYRSLFYVGDAQQISSDSFNLLRRDAHFSPAARESGEGNRFS